LSARPRLYPNSPLLNSCRSEVPDTLKRRQRVVPLYVSDSRRAVSGVRKALDLAVCHRVRRKNDAQRDAVAHSEVVPLENVALSVQSGLANAHVDSEPSMAAACTRSAVSASVKPQPSETPRCVVTLGEC
jgi:hypothetical protein